MMADDWPAPLLLCSRVFSVGILLRRRGRSPITDSGDQPAIRPRDAHAEARLRC